MIVRYTQTDFIIKVKLTFTLWVWVMIMGELLNALRIYTKKNWLTDIKQERDACANFLLGL